MNNTIKIIIAGGIGTIVQKAAGLNSLSLEGFALFMVVFVLLRLGLDVVFPQKELSQLEIELIETKKRVRRKKIFNVFKYIFFIVAGYLILNSAINYLFLKTNIVYNQGFKPQYDTSKATIVSFKDEVVTFHSEIIGYFTIIKKGDKYYILETKKYPKKDKQYLTIYDKKYIDYDLSNILRHIEKLQNGYTILKNLQFVAYKEVGKFDMITKPLWLINPPLSKVAKWDRWAVKSSLERLKLKPFYDLQKKLRQEQESITKKDLSKLSAMKLAKIFDKLYILSAFEYDTNYAIKVYKEFRKRDKKAKLKADKKYQIYSLVYRLNANMRMYINDKKINKIFKKYNLKLLYKFNYPILTQYSDIKFPPYSYIMFVDLKTSKKTQIFTNDIATKREYNMYDGIVPKLDIDIKDDKLILNRSFSKPYILRLDKQDIKEVQKLLIDILKNMMFEEKLFYGKNEDVTFNYTRANLLAIYDNDIQKLIYEYKDRKWILKSKKLLDEKYGKYKYILKHFVGLSTNIYDDLKSKKPIKYMFYNYKLNKLYDSDELKNFNIKDLIKLSVKDRDVVLVYELKDKQSYIKYSTMPRYTNIKIKNKKPYEYMAMSLISTKEIDGKYYIYLTKQDFFKGGIPNQIYYMKAFL